MYLYTKMNDKYKNLSKNTFFVFVGQAGAKLIGLIMLPFYTRWLSVEEYGITDLVTVYVTVLIGIVSCCIADAVFVYPKNQSEEIQSKYFSSSLSFVSISAIVSALIFGVLQLIALRYDIHNSFTDYIWLIYILLFAQVFQNVVQQFVRCMNKMLIYSITGIVVTLTTAIYSFIFIPKYGVYGYIISMALAYFSGFIYSLVASKSYKYFSHREYSQKHLKQLLTYSIPLIPNTITWWLTNAINRPLLEAYTSYHDIGLMAVAGKFPGIMTMLFNIFLTSWTISVIDEYGKPGYEIFFNKIMKLLVYGSMLALIGITLFSKPLILIFATEDYIDGWFLIPILSLSVVFSSLSGVVAAVFSATKESKYYFYSSMWAAAAAVIFNVVLVPSLGLWGSALAGVLSMVVMFASRVKYSWRYNRITDARQLLICIPVWCAVFAILYFDFNILLALLLTLLYIIYILYCFKSEAVIVYEKVLRRKK